MLLSCLSRSASEMHPLFLNLLKTGLVRRRSRAANPPINRSARQRLATRCDGHSFAKGECSGKRACCLSIATYLLSQTRSTRSRQPACVSDHATSGVIIDSCIEGPQRAKPNKVRRAPGIPASTQARSLFSLSLETYPSTPRNSLERRSEVPVSVRLQSTHAHFFSLRLEISSTSPLASLSRHNTTRRAGA